MSLPLMPSFDVDAIDLVAIDTSQNIDRCWSARLSPDLFGCWLLETRWGRRGTRGRARVVAHAERTAAERELTALLRRRATAERRIGVAYRLAGDAS